MQQATPEPSIQPHACVTLAPVLGATAPHSNGRGQAVGFSYSPAPGSCQPWESLVTLGLDRLHCSRRSRVYTLALLAYRGEGAQQELPRDVG